MRRLVVHWVCLFCAALLQLGCSSSPPQAETDVLPEQQMRPGPQTGRAVRDLLNQARSAAQAGDDKTAEAQLERALRIEPRNGLIWHFLAKLRLQQGRWAQALHLAAKSTSLSHGNKVLQAENWRIIAYARQELGDMQGAQAAQAKAHALQRQ